VRLVYYGTPSLAVPPLRRLVADGRAPLLVVTRRDRPRGRGLATSASPVRAEAEAHGLPVATPARAGAPEEIERVRGLQPDLIVLVAYGQILPRALLEVPRLGALNVHFSLLPRHRGAAPVQAAILAGDRETGVTTMWMTDRLDEGPTFLALRLPIEESETAGALGDRLAALGAEALVRTLDRIERGELVRDPQPEEGATYAPKIASDAGKLSLGDPADALVRRVRAFFPAPGAYLELAEHRLLVAEAAAGERADGPGARVPGTVLGVDSGRGLEIALHRGSIWLRRVRPSGRREMTGREYANGARLRPGDRLPLRASAT
jgi:methionyl-tRNA formyltransferase